MNKSAIHEAEIYSTEGTSVKENLSILVKLKVTIVSSHKRLSIRTAQFSIHVLLCLL